MIPKKIHFCWLSGEKIPFFLLKCINSWKKILPDYEIICWDKKRFNGNRIRFVKEACSRKKWAFAADYIRLYAIYKEGGIYLDSDVLLKKNFNEFLVYDFFSAVEWHPIIIKEYKTGNYINPDGTSKKPFTPIPGIGIQAAFLGGIKRHPFLKDCMEYYENKQFIQNDGSLNDRRLAPGIYARTAEKYGFKYLNQLQLLKNNMLILPSKSISSTPSLASDESFAIHYCKGSWRKKRSTNFGKKMAKNLANNFKSNNYIRKIFRKPILEDNFWK